MGAFLGQAAFGLFGLTVLIGIGWLFSANKRAVDWKLVGTGVVLYRGATIDTRPRSKANSRL